MESETLIVAHIVRLMRGSPGVAWELIPPSAATRAGDVGLRSVDGSLLGYARPILGEPRECRSNFARATLRRAAG
jgi:hypothetical protein